MKTLKLSLVCFFFAISCVNNMYTSQLEEEKSTLENDSLITLTTLIHNQGQWEEDKINEVSTIFKERCKKYDTKENPLYLSIVTQNGRKIKTSSGTTEFESYLAKVSVLRGDSLVHQGIYELNAGKVRARTLSK